MQLEHGTTIHRIWNLLDEAELLAVFVYNLHAETVCKAMLEREPENTCLACVDHYSGKMSLFRKEAKKP